MHSFIANKASILNFVCGLFKKKKKKRNLYFNQRIFFLYHLGMLLFKDLPGIFFKRSLFFGEVVYEHLNKQCCLSVTIINL